MIPAPDNLTDAQRDQIARIWTLLDAFAACRYGGGSNSISLGMHESARDPVLSYAVADWCKRNGARIEHHVTTSHGRTYEVWSIQLDVGCISAWPLKIGLLDGKDELRNKIEEIRKEADERIQQLLEVEQAKAAVS